MTFLPTININENEDEMVKFLVGASQEEFPRKIPKSILVKASTWFDRALNKGFLESQTLTIKFPDTEKDIVELFSLWLCHGEIFFDTINPEDKQEIQFTQNVAVKLWIFGDEHLLPKLQNAAMEILHASVKKVWLTIETITEAYENSPENGALRALVMREVVSGLRTKKLGENKGYSATELEGLGSIPGFTTDLAEQFASVLYLKSGRVDRLRLEDVLIDDNDLPLQ